MSVPQNQPGIFVEQTPSGVASIAGVPTSVTAFLGQALKGPLDTPIRVDSFADFEMYFGGLWVESALGYAVQQYFVNGGSVALIVRIASTDAVAASITAATSDATEMITIAAASVGAWGNNVEIQVDHSTTNPTDISLFNLRATERVDGSVRSVETFRELSISEQDLRSAVKVLAAESSLVHITKVSSNRPLAGTFKLVGGANGPSPTALEVTGSLSAKTGLYALEKADIFNLLCIPSITRDAAIADDAAGLSLLRSAMAYCEKKRAILLVDPPSVWNDVADVTSNVTGIESLGLRSPNIALYFPPIKIVDPLRANRLETFAPSAAVAGIIAQTDSQRGVWVAPAGPHASFAGVSGLATKLTDGDVGALTQLGINCLRSFPVWGPVVWGARTLEGAGHLSSEWKYLPIRRLAFFIEESILRGTQWVVFETNDESLWAQLRMLLGTFMKNLFMQGAFQGTSSNQAYFVACDSQTTTQADRDRGLVNFHVGFAPVRPAEFVVIKFQQLARQEQV